MRVTGKLTEAGFTRTVLEYAKLCGWKRAHFRPGRVLRGGRETYETPVAGDGRGFPDLLLCRGETLIVAELKVGRGRTTPEQDAWIEAFRRAGVRACVWRPETWAEIQEVLR